MTPISKINGIAYTALTKVNGIAKAALSNVNGIAVPSGGGPDAYTVALLHMNEADGSTNFIDETGKTWTAVGNAQIDTAQKVFGSASGLFDGTGDNLTTADHADWRLDGGSNSNEWTIDFRVRFNGDPGTGAMGFVGQTVNSNAYWMFLLNNNVAEFRHKTGGTITIQKTFAWNPATATWYHIALVKQGTTGYKFFVDGTQVGSALTDTDVMTDFAASLTVAVISDGVANYYLNGWMDELRISKGIARWTANFTPPSAEY